MDITRMKKIPIAIPRSQPAAAERGVFDDYSSAALHSHACHQLLVIRDGISILIDKRLKQPLFSDLCAFLPADCEHRNVVSGGSVTYQSLYIRKSAFSSKEKGVSVFSLSRLGMALFDALAEDSSRNFRSGIGGGALRLFLDVVSRDMSLPVRSVKLPCPVSSECSKLADYIEENYAHTISGNDFRSVLPYSTRHIARIFSEEMKMTLFDYLRGCRMLHASVMLHDPSRSVLEVSLACGYESLSVFYADFGRYFSGTPKDLRVSAASKRG